MIRMSHLMLLMLVVVITFSPAQTSLEDGETRVDDEADVSLFKKFGVSKYRKTGHKSRSRTVDEEIERLEDEIVEEAKKLDTKSLEEFIKRVMMVKTPHESDWNYNNTSPNGPNHWQDHYAECGKTEQSPINIKPTAAVVNRSLTDFQYFSYNSVPKQKFSMTNNGHTVEIGIKDTDIKISNGGLSSTYNLAQFHFHWGPSNSEGSEHTLDGKSSPLEIHLVHWNSGKYPTFAEAMPKLDGLAVLGVLVQVGDPKKVTINSQLGNLASLVSNVADPDKTVDVPQFPINSLLPASKTFYRYPGSLTTPPCYQSVTWTVFQQPIYITQDQMDAFRKVNQGSGVRLTKNYRPVQPLNGRVVYTSPII